MAPGAAGLGALALAGRSVAAGVVAPVAGGAVPAAPGARTSAPLSRAAFAPPGCSMVTSFTPRSGRAAVCGTLWRILGRKPSIWGAPDLAAGVLLGCPLNMPQK